jgi:hypothetical protein
LAAISKEGLTRRFFKAFENVVSEVEEAVQGIPKAKVKERRRSSLLFLSRLMFLYFIQKRGCSAEIAAFFPIFYSGR